MTIQIPTGLLEGVVLAILDKQDMYGYALTKEIQAHISVSESTIYPVLRRLQREGDLMTYDESYEGRIRRYYQITTLGQGHLTEIEQEWATFSTHITTIFRR